MSGSRLQGRGFGASAAALIAVVAAGSITAGCEKALLSDKDERSQFDRYDAVRAQRAPPYVEDEFGRMRPNLRGRLLNRQ